jgi:hypothetical protein
LVSLVAWLVSLVAWLVSLVALWVSSEVSSEASGVLSVAVSKEAPLELWERLASSGLSALSTSL